MQSVRNIAHLFLSARARAAGIKIGKGVKLSLGGDYMINKTACATLNDEVWLAQDHHIEAADGAEIHIGANVHFGARARIVAGPQSRIFIKPGCFFNHDTSIVALNNIVIGENSIFGPYTYISDHNHQFALERLIKDQLYDTQPLHIGSDVWLGVGVTILKGADLGDGCVVAARAVVNKQIPRNEVWAGVPAKKIGERH